MLLTSHTKKLLSAYCQTTKMPLWIFSDDGKLLFGSALHKALTPATELTLLSALRRHRAANEEWHFYLPNQYEIYFYFQWAQADTFYHFISGPVFESPIFRQKDIKQLSFSDLFSEKKLQDIIALIPVTDSKTFLYNIRFILLFFTDYAPSYTELKIQFDNCRDKDAENQRHTDFRKNPAVEACKDYIHRHLCEKISLEALSKEVKLNEKYLSRLFVKKTGQNINHYILEKRLESARHLLMYSDVSFSKISDYLGFSSQSYFIYVFRKSVGCTPKDYREKYWSESW